MTNEIDRPAAMRRALWLEYATVGWNLAEGVIAVAIAVGVSSVALLGFGADSFVEASSAMILIWRLRAERTATDPAHIDALDRKARRLVGVSLFVLAAFVTFKAAESLWQRDLAEPTAVGMALLGVSLALMLWLARAKRRVARLLGSAALEADAFQTTACWWLSITALCGIALNATLGWWWADPVAAVAMTVFIVREGREAWRGENCCSAGCSE